MENIVALEPASDTCYKIQGARETVRKYIKEPWRERSKNEELEEEELYNKFFKKFFEFFWTFGFFGLLDFWIYS